MRVTGGAHAEQKRGPVLRRQAFDRPPDSLEVASLVDRELYGRAGVGDALVFRQKRLLSAAQSFAEQILDQVEG